MIVGPSLKMGGMERASVNLANAYSSMGYDVLFLSLFKQEHFFNLDSKISLIEPNSGFNRVKLNFWYTLRYLKESLFKNNPTYVIVYNNFYAAIVLLAFARIKIPIFISDRASPIYKWPIHIKLFNLIIFRIFPPTGVFAQTKVAKDYQSKLFSQKVPIKVIPNILREVKVINTIKKNQILAVGRLGDELKGFDRLIEAFALIDTSWTLVFAGGDSDGFQLKEQAKKLNILDRVIFLGKVKDIDRVYAESKIFVIPSRSEGFPNALCEAMVAGLACISFDFIAGPRDIINNNVDGIIVPNGNIKLLANAIKNLIDDTKKRIDIGGNAKRIRLRYNKKIVINKIIKFIEYCIK